MRVAIGKLGPWPLAALALLALAAPARGAGIEVEAELEPDLVGVGQFVTLTLEARIEGSTNLALDPSFGLENLEIVSGPAQSQQVSFVNGRISRRQSLRWTLRPVKAGTARVRDLRLAVNDEIFELPEQVLEVQRDPVEKTDAYGRPARPADPFSDLFEPFDPLRRGRRQPAAEPKLFLRAEATPRRPYVGQQVVYSLLLFTQADIGAVNPDNLPDFEGFWVLDIEQPQRPKSVMTEVQGERYGRVVLLQKALFPLRQGPLTLDAVEARLIARIPETSWLGSITSYDKEYSLSSNPITLEVQPLPEPPPDFRGAVGQLEISSELQPRRVEVGQAATLAVSLSGRGHVQGLPSPELPELPGVRVFPPEQEGSETVVGTTVRGTKSWSWVLVPERAGAWEIPAFEYPFFDPDARAFATAVSQPKVFLAEVAAAEAATQSPEAETSSSEAQPVPEGGSAPKIPRRFSSLPLVVAGSLLVAAALALTVGRSAGRRLLARRKARRVLRSRLRQAAGYGQPARVAQAVESAWREYLAERWQIGPATAPGEWPRSLAERGAPQAATAAAGQLASDLHYLRYAPELSAHDSLRHEIVELSERLAKALR